MTPSLLAAQVGQYSHAHRRLDGPEQKEIEGVGFKAQRIGVAVGAAFAGLVFDRMIDVPQQDWLGYCARWGSALAAWALLVAIFAWVGMGIAELLAPRLEVKIRLKYFHLHQAITAKSPPEVKAAMREAELRANSS